MRQLYLQKNHGWRDAYNPLRGLNMSRLNGKQLSEPAAEYEVDPSPSEQLEKALELLDGVRSPKYSKQLKEAIELIASAKQWYDSTVLRDPVLAP